MEPSRHEDPTSFGNPYLRTALFVLVVLLMGNLGAIVDMLLHPEIEYFDQEHLVVGIVTMFVTTVLFGGLALYARNQERALKGFMASEEARGASEERYREIFEQSRDVIFISTPDGYFEDINPAGVEAFGYSSLEEIKHVDIAKDIYVNPAERELLKLRLEQEGHVKNHELEMKKKTGERLIFSVTASLLRGKDGKADTYHGILHDITEQRELHRQLLQSQKMESVGRLAGGIAHDFNNLLTTIQGYADMARSDGKMDAEAAEYLEEIRKATQEATGLAAQLLLFSQTQPADTRPFDLSRMVADALGKVDQAAGAGVSVSTDLYDGTTVVDASQENVEQALLNLVRNARAAMPDGGHLLIRTDRTSIDEGYTRRHAGAYPGDFCELSVTDTGSGMDEETKAHIFEPFFTTAESRNNGSGLGLAVVYGVVTQHDGWVEVSSEPGDGSTFRLFFPLSRQAAVDGGTVDEEGLKGQGERILLVEDDEGVRRLTEKMLGRNGYRVFGATDAREAFNLFVREKGDFQLVLCDVALPGENGIELVEQLHTHDPGLPALLMSGYSDVLADWRFVQENGCRFLQKPYQLPGLLAAVRELLQTVNQ